MKNSPLIMKGIVTLTLAFLTLPLLAQPYAKLIKKHRKAYKQAFLDEERSPFSTKKELKGLRFFPAAENYLVEATFTRTPDEKPFQMMTSSGKEKAYVKYGMLEMVVDGKPLQLAVYKSPMLSRMPGYKDYLFIPFKDATNGKTTYGGGRYLEIRTGAIKNNKVRLDFNKAYNPYCAFKKEGYNCPVPPKENHLVAEINAGEKSYAPNKKDRPIPKSTQNNPNNHP